MFSTNMDLWDFEGGTRTNARMASVDKDNASNGRAI